MVTDGDKYQPISRCTIGFLELSKDHVIIVIVEKQFAEIAEGHSEVVDTLAKHLVSKLLAR